MHLRNNYHCHGNNDLTHLSQLLLITFTTTSAVGEAILELRAIRNWETDSVHVVQQILVARSLLIHDLLVNLENESLRLMDEDASVSALRIQAAKVSLKALHREHAERVDRAGKAEKADSMLGEEEEEVRSFGEDEAEGSGQGAAASD